MTYFIVKNPPHSNEDGAIIGKLSEHSVGTLSESQDKTGVMDSGIRGIQSGTEVAGTAVTVECFPGDNIMIHAAIAVCRKGDILVVSALSSTQQGYFGELLGLASKKVGIVGLIIDGGVRDVKQLREMQFPVWSRYVNVIGTSKKNPDWVNKPIVCGGVTVNPGDYLVADDDGVVIVRRKDVFDVLKKAEEREKKESSTRQRIEKGEFSIDFYNMRPILESNGVSFMDSYEEGRTGA